MRCCPTEQVQEDAIPTVAGAYLMVRRGLSELDDGEMPERGGIEVWMHDPHIRLAQPCFPRARPRANRCYLNRYIM